MRIKINKKTLKAPLNNEYCPLNNLIKDNENNTSFTTTKLNFDLQHPVNIETQRSYDDSVNLILNDNKNIPRLINSKFKVIENNQYEIINRIGNNSTNVYHESSLDSDSSLYFNYRTSPIINYKGLIQGELLVGQYVLYFNYVDSDGNTSDYIAESGLIPVFIGEDGNPYSMDGGIKNQNSYKGIYINLTNLDTNYNYIEISYIRYFADYNQSRQVEFKKILHKYTINSSNIKIQILGTENTQDLDPNILNITRFNAANVLAQAQCKNMLFFGNISKTSDNYELLSQYSLRIIPEIIINTSFNVVNINYSQERNGTYYNSTIMYNNVGYCNGEYYRFGVVYIYENGTLSNVYNTLGYTISNNLVPEFKDDISEIVYDENYYINNNLFNNVTLNLNINAKGVCRINSSNNEKCIGIRFNIPKNIIDNLKNLGIRGLFFVRQKRIPVKIAQCLIQNIEKYARVPLVRLSNSKNLIQGFINSNNTVSKSNYTITDPEKATSSKAFAGICPDFLLNQPYYNSIFNGGKFILRQVTQNTKFEYNENDTRNRLITQGEKNYINREEEIEVEICSVTEDVKNVAIGSELFRKTAGNAEEAYRVEYFTADNPTTNNKFEDNANNKHHNYVRGEYSPYLAIKSDKELYAGQIYDIYYSNQLTETENFNLRINLKEPFYAISDRYNFDDLKNYFLICYRGDCYFNTFTYRVNRNFNDPSLPNNDVIIDQDTWKNHYYNNEWNKIVRSDINAVKLGMWITFNVESSFNYALRSEDHSYVAEEALMGSPRSFYPRSALLDNGHNKMPDSYLYNDAYRATLGYKCYYALEDVNYLKNNFSNRIQYSAVSIQDSYKNNYRESYSTYYRDYSQEYGAITKLIGFEGYLLVIFEYAICIAVINERVLAGSGEGGPVFINTQNVLPEELTVISDTYGSQWPESVVKSELGYVYGIDTSAKKIWRVTGQQIDIISNLKINSFLESNLPNDKYFPNIGTYDIRTHYNNKKKDIMFTCYKKNDNNTILWNICYNEYIDKFITFYSWIPLISENINTDFFSFNYEKNRNSKLWLHNNGFPTHWYGEYHPFEFEFVVNDKLDQQKIFNNLIIISNKAEPESFHFEIEGDNYEFSSDKRNMYYRQERTKKTFRNLGSDILYDLNYENCYGNVYERYARSLNKEYTDKYSAIDKVYPNLEENTELVQQVKSSIFPLYYERVDTYNDIYYKYREMFGDGYDFKNLSGSEIKWNRKLNQFNVVTHIKNSPIDNYGSLRGNSRYKEGKWNIQIPSITFNQKNEEPWENGIPPIVLSNVPKDITYNNISYDQIPNTYYNKYWTRNIDFNAWTYRKETQIRDKWIKIRVRYSGKNLAIIHSLITLYNVSYA